MIKKIMSFIFEEETIEDPKEEVKEKPVEIKETKVVEKREARVLDDGKEKTPVVNTAPVSEKKDQSMLNKMKVEPIPSNNTKVKKTTPVTNKPDYEFNPVISPIYGVTDEKKVQTPSHTQKKTYTSSSTPTGIVLSPINGNLKEEKVEEVKSKVEKTFEDIQDDSIKDDPIVNIPLSNMLETDTVDSSEEIVSVTEVKDLQGDKKVLLSKNLSLFDDEE